MRCSGISWRRIRLAGRENAIAVGFGPVGYAWPTPGREQDHVRFEADGVAGRERDIDGVIAGEASGPLEDANVLTSEQLGDGRSR